jgi:telomere length regulation protein
MIVGTAVSELADAKEKQMNFSAEEVESTEGQWYRNLTKLEDSVGSINDMKKASPLSKKRNLNSKAEVELSEPLVPPASGSKIVSIEEVESASDSEEDDLPVYEKPDSDASDSEEDPTLVQRDRPSAPV